MSAGGRLEALLHRRADGQHHDHDLLGELWFLSPEASPRTCIRADGREIPMKVRGHRDWKSDNYGRAEDELLREGVLRRHDLGYGRAWLLDAAAAAEYFVPRFQRDPYYFW